MNKQIFFCLSLGVAICLIGATAAADPCGKTTRSHSEPATAGMSFDDDHATRAPDSTTEERKGDTPEAKSVDAEKDTGEPRNLATDYWHPGKPAL
jgi:hypothetical protein